MRAIDLETPHGPARAHLHETENPRALLALGHGAGGGVGAKDLVAATEAAGSLGVAVALVEQPYRVAGKRSQPAASTIDSAWIAAIEGLRAGSFADLPLISGGRSAGARVACRTAAATGAIGVLCLAFPLQPPQRKAAAKPSPSRIDELDDVVVPVLVVQGRNDRFGMPPSGASREVVEVAGDHALRSDLEAVGAAVRVWLEKLLSETRR
ncbi:MAG TPA: alpha/beta family hydrolase [Solirubrobacterales bacterium]|nr:alpha/beta family hydrolase [Solirubrobacterales bacterium]